MLMTRQIATAGLIACLMTSTAHALTADQVWTGWQANLAAFDITLAAGETAVTGPASTYRDITFTPTGEQSLGIPEITLTEAADGSVTITLPPEMNLLRPLAAGATGTAVISHNGLLITVTEPEPGARSYDYAADTLSIAVTSSTMVDMFDGSTPQPGNVDFTLDFTALSGTYSDTPRATRIFANNLKAATLAYKIDQNDPFMGQTLQTAVTQDIALQGSFAIPAALDLTTISSAAQFEQAVRDGLAITLSLSQGLATSDQSMTSDFVNYSVVSESTGGDFSLGFDLTGAAMAISSLPATAKVTSSDLPIPFIDVAIGAAEMDIKVPLIGTDMQDFRYMVKIDGISVNDAAWALVDPTAILPRTPLRFDIDVTGKAAVNFLAIIAAEDAGEIPPTPQIESLQIPTLLMSGAGAEVAGSGAFTFDNSTGMPLPRGAADLTVKGANKMVDAMVAMGIITADDAMGARMGIALLLEPTADPDVMTSKIEARDDGGIYVNGQRMQ